MPQFFDRVVAKNPRRTDDGYLVADAPVARTGVQLYRGSEIGRPDLPFVRVYRPEEEVFNQDSMKSYAHRPMTNDHPDVMVDSSNWKDLAIGQTGDEVTRDGNTVRVPMVLMDQAAITLFEGGKRELSMGYTADIEFLDEEAETEDGLMYDAVQRSLKMNHLALVGKGRAGIAKIGDGQDPNTNSLPNKTGGHTMPELRKVIVDGLSVETTEAGEQAIHRLQSDLASSQQTLTDAAASHKEALAGRDSEIAKRDAEIEKLKAAQLSDSDLDARVEARADLVTKAKALQDQDYAGLSDAEIRKAVVLGKVGAEAIADKSDAYIDARFDVLVESLSTQQLDPVRKALGDSARNRPDAPDVDKAYQDNLTHLQDAYKTADAK